MAEEEQIIGLAAGNGGHVHQRHVFHRRLGAGKAAGLREHDIARVHIDVGLVGKIDHVNARILAKPCTQRGLEPLVIAGKHGDMGLLAHAVAQQAHHIFYIAKAHATAHDQNDRRCFGKTKMRPGRAFFHFLGEFFQSRDAGNEHALLSDAPAQEFAGDGRMRDEESVGAGLLHEGAAVVIGGNLVGFNVVHLVPFADMRKALRGEDMRHDHGIDLVFHKIPVERMRIAGIGNIGGRAHAGGAERLARAVARAEQARGAHGQVDVKIGHKAGKAFRGKGKRIEQLAVCPGFDKLFPHGFCGRIVACAGIAGKDQRSHKGTSVSGKGRGRVHLSAAALGAA